MRCWWQCGTYATASYPRRQLAIVPGHCSVRYRPRAAAQVASLRTGRSRPRSLVSASPAGATAGARVALRPRRMPSLSTARCAAAQHRRFSDRSAAATRPALGQSATRLVHYRDGVQCNGSAQQRAVQVPPGAEVFLSSKKTSRINRQPGLDQHIMGNISEAYFKLGQLDSITSIMTT